MPERSLDVHERSPLTMDQKKLIESRMIIPTPPLCRLKQNKEMALLRSRITTKLLKHRKKEEQPNYSFCRKNITKNEKPIAHQTTRTFQHGARTEIRFERLDRRKSEGNRVLPKETGYEKFARRHSDGHWPSKPHHSSCNEVRTPLKDLELRDLYEYTEKKKNFSISTGIPRSKEALNSLQRNENNKGNINVSIPTCLHMSSHWSLDGDIDKLDCPRPPSRRHNRCDENVSGMKKHGDRFCQENFNNIDSDAVIEESSEEEKENIKKIQNVRLNNYLESMNKNDEIEESNEELYIEHDLINNISKQNISSLPRLANLTLKLTEENLKRFNVNITTL